MKEPFSIGICGANEESTAFTIQQLVTDIPVDSESITVVSTFQANLYVGTSRGRVFHYHKFEDAPEYFLISQLAIGSEKCTRMLILPGIERTLIQCGNTVYVRTLPELSTCSIGMLRETNYISPLTQLNKNAKANAPNEKVIVFNFDKIRLIQFNSDSTKLLKEIQYSNAQKGVSCFSGTSANYSNLCLVANQKNYDIVDLQQTRKIPLFEYDSSLSDRIEPFIIPLVNDSSQEEYLLTVSSDPTTSIAMFISSLGDVTRGTISWINDGYPTNGLVAHGHYIIGVFKSPNTGYRLVFSSIQSLSAIKTIPIEEIVSHDQLNKDSNQDPCAASDTSEHLPESHSEDKKDSKVPDEDTPSLSYKICQTNDDVKFDNTRLTSMLSKNALSEESTPETKHTSKTPETKHTSKGNIFFYNDRELCLLHQEEIVMILHDEVMTALDDYDENKEKLENLSLRLEEAYKSESNHKREFLFQLNLLILLALRAFDKIEAVVYKDSSDGALLDPRLFLYAMNFDDSNAFYEDFEVYSGTKAIISKVREIGVSDETFLSFVLKESYSRIDSLQLKPSTVAHLRFLLYTTQASSSHDLVRLVDYDKDFWTSMETNKVDIMNYVESNEYYLGLFFIYRLQQHSGKPNESLAIKICDLSIKLLKEDIRDASASLSESDTQIVGGEPLNLIGTTFSELSDNFNDSETYTKYLLEMLRLRPQEGINYLKANKNNRHKLTHKNILDDISKFYKGDLQFGSLKIEYLESLFLNELNGSADIPIEVIDDLLFELVRSLVSDDLMNESNIANFEILKETFKIEHPLTDPEWPKTAWVDFLAIIKDRSECLKFLEVYLKVYELLLIRHLKFGLQGSKNFSDIQDLITPHNGILNYLCILANDDDVTDVVSQLSESCDYSTAEYFIIFNSLPLPSKPYYIKDHINTISKSFKPRHDDSVRQELKALFQMYMNTGERQGQILAARHFISAYARTYFSPLEAIELLPSFIPLPYIKEYLLEVLIVSESTKRNAILKKVMNRTESKFNERIYNDLKPADKN